MSLIIGVRCKNGCLIIADRRTHIKCGGTESHRDDFHKVVEHDGYLVYNHGYNRIGNQDWKLRVSELTPDSTNPVYAEIQEEMIAKPDRKAFYVFMNMTTLLEVVICADTGITLKDHMPNDRIVSGTGEQYVALTLLTDLQQKKCESVRKALEQTFKLAHSKMKEQGDKEFSEEYDITRL
jgi:hypothetical protein